MPSWQMQVSEGTRRSILVLIEAGRGNPDGLVAFSGAIAQRSGQSNAMVGEIAFQVRDVFGTVGEAAVSVRTDDFGGINHGVPAFRRAGPQSLRRIKLACGLRGLLGNAVENESFLWTSGRWRPWPIARCETDPV